MAEKNHTHQSISVILLIAVIVFAGLYFTKSVPNCPEVEEKDCPQPEQKAIVHSEIYLWGFNELDTSQLLFNYWIYNYGDVEAKNLKVRCKLFDANGNEASSSLHTFGNLASQSVQFGEFTPQKSSTVKMTEEYSPVCYVESCNDNCDILVSRIPEIVGNYGIN